MPSVGLRARALEEALRLLPSAGFTALAQHEEANAQQCGYEAHLVCRADPDCAGADAADEAFVATLPKRGPVSQMPNAVLLQVVALCARGRRGLIPASTQSAIVPFLLRSLTGGTGGFGSGGEAAASQRLSLTVAALAHLLDSSAEGSKVLALEGNVLQMVRLFLSRGVYPTDAKPHPGAIPPSPAQEVALCRLALARLMCLPAVDSIEAARHEVIVFVRKWWQRLALSAEGSLSVANPSPRYAIPDGSDDGGEGQLSVPPTLRAVLELMAALVDTRRHAPWLAANLRSLASELSPAFLCAFLASQDVLTAHAASRVASAFARLELTRAAVPSAEALDWLSVVLAQATSSLRQTLASISSACSRATLLAAEPLLVALARLACLCSLGVSRAAGRGTEAVEEAGVVCLELLRVLAPEAAAVDAAIGEADGEGEGEGGGREGGWGREGSTPGNRALRRQRLERVLRDGLAYALGTCSLTSGGLLRGALESFLTPLELEAARARFLQQQQQQEQSAEWELEAEAELSLSRLHALLIANQSGGSGGDPLGQEESLYEYGNGYGYESAGASMLVPMQQSPASCGCGSGSGGNERSGEQQSRAHGPFTLTREGGQSEAESAAQRALETQEARHLGATADMDGGQDWSYEVDESQACAGGESPQPAQHSPSASLDSTRICDASADGSAGNAMVVQGTRQRQRQQQQRQSQSLSLSLSPAASATTSDDLERRRTAAPSALPAAASSSFSSSACATSSSETSGSSWPRRALEAEKAALYQSGLLRREQQLRAEQEQALSEAWGKMSALAEAEALAQTERASASAWADACQDKLLREQERGAELETELAKVQARIAAEQQARATDRARAEAVLGQAKEQAQKEASALRELLAAAEARLAAKAADEAALLLLFEESKAQALVVAQAQAGEHAAALQRAASVLTAEQAAHRCTAEELERVKTKVDVLAADLASQRNMLASATQSHDREKRRADALQAELASHRNLLSFIANAAGNGKLPAASSEGESEGGKGAAAQQQLSSIHRLSMSLSQQQGDKENQQYFG